MDDNKLLKQHALCLETADKVMQRKQYMNIFFFGINTITVQLLIVFLIYAKHVGSLPPDLLLCMAFGALALGSINCWAWFCLLDYYRGLIYAKYEVIQQMEKSFHFKPYSNEKEILAQIDNETSFPRLPVLKVESGAPLAFLFLYVAFVLAVVTVL